MTTEILSQLIRRLQEPSDPSPVTERAASISTVAKNRTGRSFPHGALVSRFSLADCAPNCDRLRPLLATSDNSLTGEPFTRLRLARLTKTFATSLSLCLFFFSLSLFVPSLYLILSITMLNFDGRFHYSRTKHHCNFVLHCCNS